MFTLSSISSDLGFWSVNHTSIYKNSESKVFKNIKFLSEISNNWPSDLLATDTRFLNLVDNSCWLYYSGLIQPL